ncbi:hypothetical protein ABZ712_11105 [Streptomyces sp. NPDC006906]|uniref:hypothetical protein n=1 Tax=Streptomyces sp. NPDC006906 TaxID=3154782 RepID=UPI00340CA3E4
MILTDGSDSDQDANSVTRSGLVTVLLVAERRNSPTPSVPSPASRSRSAPTADRDDVAGIARVTGGDGYEVSDPVEIRAVIRAMILQAIMAAGQNRHAARE